MKKVNKRLLSAVLAVMLFFTCCPVTTWASSDPAITYEGRQVEQLSMNKREKLTVEVEALPGGAHQWQIYVPDADLWVDIMGQTDPQLDLSYGLLGSVLKEDMAQVRCADISGEEPCYTDPLRVTFTGQITQAPEQTDVPAKSAFTELPQPVEEQAAMLAITPGETNETNTEIQIVTVTVHFRAVNRLGNFETTGEDASVLENAVNARPAADSESAHIIKGSGLDITLPCRVIPGYSLQVPSYYGADSGISVDGNNLKLNLPNVTEDTQFYIYYVEKTVPYGARYFMQNVYNDLYTEKVDVLSEEDKAKMYGYPGDKPDETIIYPIYPGEEERPGNPAVMGFTPLFFQPDTIAADGSTVFEVYYDRMYYLINFDLNDGFGTAPVYARYDTSFVVATPTRPGYTFAGWELISGTLPEGAETDEYGLVKKIPATNLIYRAKWTQQQTTYTVAYWKENAEDNGYTFWGVSEKTAQTGSYVSGQADVPQTIHGGEGDYFTFNPVLSDKDVLVEGDGTSVVNVYYTRNYYTITFRHTSNNSSNCGIPTNHTHMDDCYRMICVGGHTHTEECGGTLTCQIPQHTAHTAECLTCDIPEHTHNALCSCQLDEHTHTASCWRSNVGTAQNRTPTGAPSSPANGQIYVRNNNRYIYLFGRWYTYTNRNVQNGQIIDSSCGKDEHTHTDACSCKISQHSHDSGCYRDALHSHRESCYSYTCEQQSHEHTDACKQLICAIPENHTHSSNTCAIKLVTRKYQQSLDDIWHHYEDGEKVFGLQDDRGNIYDEGQRWKPSNSSYYSEVLVYIANMPGDDFTLTLDTSTNSEKTMYYYFQVLPGEPYDREYEGKYYKLEITIKARYGYMTEAEDFFEVKGYEKYESDPAFSGGKISQSTASFYYNRIVDHYLKFSNNGLLMPEKERYGIPYGEVITDEYFVPDYPANLEPDAYVFEQWYTTEGYYEGTEVDWNTLTMPEGDLLLYAKWNPVSYDTYFYMDYDRYQSGDYFQMAEDTPHGQRLIATDLELMPTHDLDDTYTFVNWFYIDGDGSKKAFNPAEMAIRKELHLFAEWTTIAVQEYTVSYQYGVLDKNTNQVIPSDPPFTMAEDLTGYAMRASTKTFTAKPVSQLTDFPVGGADKLWLPHTNSHSIVIRENNEENVFTFYYLEKENAPYIVRYLDAATGQPLLFDEDGNEIIGGDPNNRSAVVTVPFRYVEGYIPEAFHKQLVLSANEEENVVVFYYTKDDYDEESGEDKERTLYLIAHHYPELDGSDRRIEEDGVGVVGEKATTVEQSIPGFEFDEKTTKNKYADQFSANQVAANVAQKDGQWTVSGIITTGEDTGANKALELHLYYKRICYGYTIVHKDYDTGEVIKTETVGIGVGNEAQRVPFETTVQVKSEGIVGYDLYAADPDGTKTQSLTISWDDSMNVVTFYYIQKKITVNYLPVCSASGLNNYGAVSNPVDFDTLTPAGSQAYAASGFRFMGWYENWGTAQQKLVTTSAQYIPKVDTGTGVYEYTYYAVFTPITLTISQKNMAATDSAVYEVVQGNTVVARVILTGTDSVTIYAIQAGTYTVREVSGNWSWTYTTAGVSPGNGQVQVTVEQNEEMVFDYQGCYKGACWLFGERRN